MADDTSGFDISYSMLMFMYVAIAAGLVCSLSGTYESKSIPDYKIQIIQHNLESTPIMDILSGEDCQKGDAGNILGYYYGFEAGFKYNGISYSEEYRDEICGDYGGCIKVNRQREVPYRILKGKRLCTSKRPNKNYFDYVDSSVDLYDNCPSGTRSCGRLDKDRNLCIKVKEECPINDIVYNNQSTYEKDSIIYTTVKINENEFIHYTNRKTDNFIITNLTVLGGNGYGFPCGGNDNNKIRVYSLIENNLFCRGSSNAYKYYFFKYLTSVPLEDFYGENNLDLSDLPEYENLTALGNMSVFSTGFFSLSEDDISNLKDPDGLKKNNNYSNTLETCSWICFISILVIGGHTFILFIGIFLGNTLAKLIFVSISVVIILLINICGIIEIVVNNYFFELSGFFPSYLDYEVKDMDSSIGTVHFWPFFPLLLINILFLICYIRKYKKENYSYLSIFDSPSKKTKKKKSRLIQDSSSTEINTYDNQYQTTPQANYNYPSNYIDPLVTPQNPQSSDFINTNTPGYY